MSIYTSEPWFAVNNGVYWEIRTENGIFFGEQIGDTCASNHITAGPNGEANTKRIVACVNGCKGINPDAVQDLLKACIESLARFEQDGWPLNDANLSAINTLRNAIEKATGSAQ